MLVKAASLNISNFEKKGHTEPINSESAAEYIKKRYYLWKM